MFVSETKVFTEERPWGEFREYALNEPVTVKTIHVKHGGVLSLQYHRSRSEFWRILSGNPVVTLGERVIHAKTGDEFTISAGTHHRIAAPEGDVEFLEIARGKFDEGDIVRLDDQYGRI